MLNQDWIALIAGSLHEWGDVIMAIPIDYFKNDKDIKVFKAGENLFEAGQVGNCMYAIRSGTVEIYFNNRLIETVGAGGYVGEKALIDINVPHTTTAYAQTDVETVIVDEHEFLYLIHETPMFALHVMRVLSERARSALRIAVG